MVAYNLGIRQQQDNMQQLLVHDVQLLQYNTPKQVQPAASWVLLHCTSSTGDTRDPTVLHPA